MAAELPDLWRAHYFRILGILRDRNIPVTDDPESGAGAYIGLRRQWNPHNQALRRSFHYDEEEIFCP